MAEERLDVLDESGKNTGATISKKDAHLKGAWHQVVHIWIYNSKGEVLLQKRSAEKELHPGLWDTSAAGHISAGESPEEGAVRELHEELGIKIRPNGLQKVMTVWVDDQPMPGYRDLELVHVYLCRQEVLPTKLQKGEVEAVKFIPLGEFEKEMSSPNAAACKCVEGVAYGCATM